MNCLPLLTVRHRAPAISDLTLGGAPIAGLYTPIARSEALLTVKTALKLGFTSYDTAPLYGAGRSEKYIGEVLKERSGLYVATKVGRVIRSRENLPDKNVVWGHDESFKLDGDPIDVIPVDDFSSEGVRESFRQSSARMEGVPISCLRLHDAETDVYFDWATKDGGAIDTLVQMRKEGLIKHVSLGMNKADYLLKYIRKYPVGTFDNILVAGCWNLLDQSGYELLSLCQTQRISVTLAGIFGSGLLWGGNYLRYQLANRSDLEKRDKWAELASKHGCTLPGVALAFAFIPLCVDKICVGCQTESHVEANVALCNEKVPIEIWGEAKSMGLLPSWLPIPV